MDVDPGYKYIEKIRGGIQWYMMNTKDFISSNNIKKKKTMNLYHSMDKELLFVYLSKKYNLTYID